MTAELSDSTDSTHHLLIQLQGARDNLGILFELDFQFLIPGLSLETTEGILLDHLRVSQMPLFASISLYIVPMLRY